MVTIYTTWFNNHKFLVLPTQCVYVFCVDLRTNSDYFTVQHWLVGFYNRGGVFTARYVLHSAFCPHSVFMCFVWIWEQTAIISLYNIDWLVFITETECVYCAVRTERLTIIQANRKLQNAVPWFRRLVFNQEARVRSQVGPCRFVVNRVALGQFSLPVLRFPPGIVIAPLLRTHLHVSVGRRTNRWSLGTFQHTVLSEKWGSIACSSTFAF